MNWKLAEITQIERRTRKILTANKLLHPRADIDRLYLPRCDGGRGLCCLEDKFQTAIVGLAKYLEIQKNDRLISLVKSEDATKPQTESIKKKAAKIAQTVSFIETFDGIDENKEATEIVKELKKKLRNILQKQREERWCSKPLHGQYANQASNASTNRDLTFAWLKKGDVKGETEALITAAQDQALATNYHKKHIMKLDVSPLCRLCKTSDETIYHLTSGCSVLAGKEYLDRHNQVAKNLHYNICKNYNFTVPEQWYQHTPQTVEDNHDATILWDMQIRTDRCIQANKPDIVIKDKNARVCYLIDVSVPADGNVTKKEIEKVLKYKDLQIEVQRMWNYKTKVIPVVIGATGTMSRNCQKYLTEIPGNNRYETIFQIQKSAIFGTAHIIRKVL